MPAAVALLTGPIYLLLIAKVPKHGPLIVVGVVEGLLLFATGMYWGWAVACVVLGIAADIIAGIGRFRSKALNFTAFVVYSLSPMGSYLMLWANPTGYASYLVGKGAEQAYGHDDVHGDRLDAACDGACHRGLRHHKRASGYAPAAPPV